MPDLDSFEIAPPPKQEPRAVADTPAPEWHSLAWRPSGSMSLAERWLKAGETRAAAQPPSLKRRR